MSDNSHHLPLRTLLAALATKGPIRATVSGEETSRTFWSPNAYRGPCTVPSEPVGRAPVLVGARVSAAGGEADVSFASGNTRVTLPLPWDAVFIDLGDGPSRALIDRLLAHALFPNDRADVGNVAVYLVPDPINDVSYLIVACGLHWAKRTWQFHQQRRFEVDTTDPLHARVLVWGELARGVTEAGC